jgi:N-acetylmuramoyl-L-alanine amidase
MSSNSLVRVLFAMIVAAFGLSSGAATSSGASPAIAARTAAKPLAGIVIALDPGHQLGNSRHLRQINRLVTGGRGLRKPCNTTGTATNAGYPEATMTWQVVKQMRKKLRALGAKVRLTRTVNSTSAWGPCVDVRGRFGAKVHAKLLVSVHGDGAVSSGHGFFTIAPARARMLHPKVQARSVKLAKALRKGMLGKGFTTSTYVRGGYYTRTDLGTLNLSGVPVAMIELGNMRNRGDAHTMTTATGRARYAAALVSGIRRFLGR